MRQNSLTEPGCVFMHMRQPYNTEGNIILEDLLREPSDLRLFDEK
jgi:hypothetical protein